MHEDSCDCLKSELVLFSVAPTQTSIENGCFAKYYPITTLDQGGPIEFKITAGSDKYIDANNIILYTRCRILYQSGNGTIPNEVTVSGSKVFNEDAKVAPINYFHATQFKNVEVHLNEKLINPSDNLYPYRAYFEMLLSHGTDSKKNQLKMGLFWVLEIHLDTIDTQEAGWLCRKLAADHRCVGDYIAESIAQ